MRAALPWRARAVAAGLILALLQPATALAHAVLLTTEPGNDTVLRRAPEQVTLRFNEPVDTALGSLRVYDSRARRVDDGRVTRPTGEAVAVGLDGRLRRGTYTATYRVTSADSHPVSGAFVFHVGAPGANPAGVASLIDDATPRSVTASFAVARFLDLGLILLVVGGSVALVWVLGAAAPEVRRRLATVVAAGALGLALIVPAGLVLQGAASGGYALGEAARAGVVEAVLDTRFGHVWAAQALIAVAVAAVALLARRRPRALPLVAGLALLLVPLPALAGHAGASGTLSAVADSAHVAGAALWTGGLAFVVLALVWAAERRWQLAASAVSRFSALAVASVVVLVAAGVVNGYLQTRALRGLWETSYGLLLMAKVALLLPLLALALYNNRFAVPRLRRQVASAAEQRRFLRMVSVELGLFVAVVAVTAALVAEPPAKATVAPDGPYAVDTTLGALTANVVVDPARTGRNAIHLYLLDENGRPVDVDAVSWAATLPSRQIGPLRFTGRRLAPGHYSAYGAHLALAGDWQLLLDARRGEFESLQQTVSIEIQED